MEDSNEYMLGWNEGWDVDVAHQLLPLLQQDISEQEEICQLVGEYVMPYVCKEPRRTSRQTGQMWVNEILQGHPDRCYEMFRMEKHLFRQLCATLDELGLKKSKKMRVEEMVEMFLNTIGHGVGNRMIQERFQHSVHRNFHKILAACLNLSKANIKPFDPSFQRCHSKIQNDLLYWPFFKDAIGAIDGTHVPCVVSVVDKIKFIGRKGYATQNVMAVCDWDMCFTFVIAGWEGTAHDARVFDNAISTPSMHFPHPPSGKYYLVDSGYPTLNGYLDPYRCERYHLPDFRRVAGFANNNEVFNYYHSSLRCTIERTFEVWKNRRNSIIDEQFIQAKDESVDVLEEDIDIGEAYSSNLPRSLRQMQHVRDIIRDQLVNHIN
ncbi:uncharacterized protein LOC129319776 [Prosopis cineraria]|uniref:uncharacterized protein LOC129319776 n=1 Tax=Prosopis cineraria TaxID=364024 RepID=UPI00240F9F6B|nr:uncharacterized protein LOC129319776 [Prosopis cineraria]